ncbi:MAG: CBS domain-containing protein, partial [Chloroflexota bacterium]
MNVIDIMTRSPVTIRPDAMLGEALEIMDQVGCRHLPVLSAEKHLVGIVSDRDCRLALNSPNIMRERW